ncbi:MAG: hypothetical protein ISS71_03490 [Phycisphaerae bacterium]|nr:hypothetical protein [Phycisphaerae bacterium]
MMPKDVKLDAGEFKEWMQLTSGTIKTTDGEKTLKELGQNDKICPMQRVTVPNTFGIVIGQMTRLQYLFLGASADRVTIALGKRGFAIEYYDYQRNTIDSSDIGNLSKRNWWGFGLFGHGQTPLLGADGAFAIQGHPALLNFIGWEATDLLLPAHFVGTNDHNFKYGGFIGAFCWSGFGGWRDITYGKAYTVGEPYIATEGPLQFRVGTWDGLVAEMTGVK